MYSNINSFIEHIFKQHCVNGNISQFYLFFFIQFIIHKEDSNRREEKRYNNKRLLQYKEQSYKKLQIKLKYMMTSYFLQHVIETLPLNANHYTKVSHEEKRIILLIFEIVWKPQLEKTAIKFSREFTSSNKNPSFCLSDLPFVVDIRSYRYSANV